MKFSPDDLERLRSENDLGVDYRVRVRIFTAEEIGRTWSSRVRPCFAARTTTGGCSLIRDGRANCRPSKIGLTNDEQAEITSGLAEGEQVILGRDQSADGQAVEVFERSPDAATT